MRWDSGLSGSGSSATAALPLEEIGCRAGEPACINGVMASFDHTAAIARPAALPLVRRGHPRWLVRAPGRRGALSVEEVAYALNAQRAELRARLDRMPEVARLPGHVRDELVDDAIHVVVMLKEPIQDEQHLRGAFWKSVGFLLMEHRAGRHDVRVGSRRRIEFEPLAEVLHGDDDEPFDLVAAQERRATAADLMAQLDPFEQRVMAVMAAHDLGVKRAAKAMGEPFEVVLAASRSARRKRDQVAAIYAAGRMCDYRRPALHAHAHGTARAEQEQAARAHLAACASCRSAYAALLREMRGRDFRRAASAAFLPPPVLAVELHSGWVERLTALLSTGRAPSGTATAERTAGLLGGGGLVKAAAVTSAIVVAGAGVGSKVVHSLESTTPVRHHHKGAGRSTPVTPTPRIAPTTVVTGRPTPNYTTTVKTVGPRLPRLAKHHHSVPAPPSKDLEYLTLGGGTGTTTTTPTRPKTPVAVAAKTPTESPTESPPEAPAPSRTGGGTGLGYLGH